MKNILTLLFLTAATAFGLESIPALWHHGLNSTYLTDYHKGEHLIISDIWTGTPAIDAVIKHSLQVKVSGWDRAYTENSESDDKHHKETLTVTLHETKNPKEMKADFDHTVYEDDHVVLRFSGVTVLARPN
jgi:hypothetical protein